jgi:uncharacterized protein YcbK (DUF882 family)
MTNYRGWTRRRILAAAISIPAISLPGLATAASSAQRLRFWNTHTNEKLDIVYRDKRGTRPDALAQINHILRDHRTGTVTQMDAGLLDILSALYDGHGSTGRFEIISGYRSPASNEMLRHRSGGVAKNSYHTLGQAIDIRLSDVSTSQLRDSALELGRGGVGYYASDDFIHVDTGRVRFW